MKQQGPPRGGQRPRSSFSRGSGNYRRKDEYGAWQKPSNARKWGRAYKQSPPTPKDPLSMDISEAMPVNISFGNFEFQESKNLGQRGGGVRELSSLLRHARRQVATHTNLLRSTEGIQKRNEDLLSAAVQRASGVKVKDDPKKLSKALAKRRSKKRQSAKRWAKRIKSLENSVENVVKDRSIMRQTMRARKQAKEAAKTRKSAPSGKVGVKSKSAKKSGGKSAGGGFKKGKLGGGKGKRK